MHVGLTEAKKNFPDLLARAEAGERITITRRGRAIAELASTQQRRKPTFGTLKGAIKEIDPDWHRPQEDIEAWLRGDL